MVIDMREQKLVTVVQLREFLAGTAAVDFVGCRGNDEERYRHIAAVVRRFRYNRLKRPDKGVVVRYLIRTTSYSRQQLTRLIKRALQGPLGKRYRAPTHGFVQRYTDADVALLARTDALHGTLSGPATRHLCERAYATFGDPAYARLARISVAHLYNLRRRTGYQKLRRVWTKTRGKPVSIAVRRPPRPDGRPGYIRIDSVHQGDQDGIKGVFHINAVDCVTQWELVATCEKISEAYLLPVLAVLLAGFPFGILGFHADNGSEYINRLVAELLNKLNVEFTKSRPRHSNDNGLAETKNGAIIRKQFGYAHIPQHFASLINTFCTDYLNPYLNFHRPCLFPETTVDKKGKERKRYPLRLVKTPFEQLACLPNADRYLRPGTTLATLRQQAEAMTDNDAAARLAKARSDLFRTINRRSRTAA